jgi:hypothetical protein
MAEPKYRRVDIGFKAGAVLSVRLQEDQYEKLRSALNDSDDRWHELDAEDATISVDTGQVIYVRLDTERDRVGF